MNLLPQWLGAVLATREATGHPCAFGHCPRMGSGTFAGDRCCFVAGPLRHACKHASVNVESTAGSRAQIHGHPELDLGLPPRSFGRTRSIAGTRARLSAQELVREFHLAFGLPLASRPRPAVPQDLQELRIDLLVEEVTEYVSAARAVDTIALADALADVVYVAYGAALSYGIDLDRVIEEVHRSNMSKLGEDGRPLYRADGKVLKGPHYSPPAVRDTLLDQPPLFLD